MAGNLWSCNDYQSQYVDPVIYKHSGGTATIVTSFIPAYQPSGIMWDGDNLWGCSRVQSAIYQHSGETSTITTSFSTDALAYDIAWDGTNVWWISHTAVYQQTGKTSTVHTSFSTVGTNASGITFDGTDLWTTDFGTDVIYRHSGKTSTISASFAAMANGPQGLGWDGDNLWECDDGEEKIYKHSGRTATITTSFDAPNHDIGSVTWEPPPPAAPTVTTQTATNIQETTLTGNGNITSIGSETVTRRGFCYITGTSGDPTTADSVAYDDGSFEVGAYTKGLTGLSRNTAYRVRAYAVNSVGTSYGATVAVTTLAGYPTVTTQAATDEGAETVTGNGNVTDDGDATITRRGFCYMVGTTGDPTTADSVAYNDGSFDEGAFNKAINGLTPETGYRVRAYAVNSRGTGYGGTVQATTTEAPITFIPRITWIGL